MQELSAGGKSHPYRHPVLQKAINLTWFRNKDDEGVFFHEHFSPLSVKAIALILAVVSVVFILYDSPRILTNLSTVIRSSAVSMSGRMAHARILGGVQSSSRPRTNHTSAQSMSSVNMAPAKAQICLNTYGMISSRKHGRSSSHLAYASLWYSFANARLGRQKTCRCPACTSHRVRQILLRITGSCTPRRSSPVFSPHNQDLVRLRGMIAQAQSLFIYLSFCFCYLTWMSGYQRAYVLHSVVVSIHYCSDYV